MTTHADLSALEASLSELDLAADRLIALSNELSRAHEEVGRLRGQDSVLTAQLRHMTPDQVRQNLGTVGRAFRFAHRYAGQALARVLPPDTTAKGDCNGNLVEIWVNLVTHPQIDQREVYDRLGEVLRLGEQMAASLSHGDMDLNFEITRSDDTSPEPTPVLWFTLSGQTWIDAEGRAIGQDVDQVLASLRHSHLPGL